LNLWLITPQKIAASSLDGTVNLQYLTQNYVLHNGDSAQGLIRFNNGFTVLPNATVLMDTFLTVSGGFDLGDTGVLMLNGNLYLDGKTTLTSGGYLMGKASIGANPRTLFLGGNLILQTTPLNRVLHITGNWSDEGTSGDLIIDGQGHTLCIGDNTQIFVDTNITLTLRNMTLKTGALSNRLPAIRLATPGSTLALDNVVMDLGADFNFNQGRIFIHNEVAITGTSAFVYHSPNPSYITSGATWLFDQGTTFSVAPATFTSASYLQDPTATSTPNNFIAMADPSSVLYLNGCSFKTTFTGLRLTNGTVLLNNGVNIDTQAAVDVASTPATYLSGVGLPYRGWAPPAWSPDGRLVAQISQGGNGQLLLYQFTIAGGASLVSSVVTDSFNTYWPLATAWSPDGHYIAVVCWYSSGYSPKLLVFTYNGTTTLQLVGSITTDSQPTSLAWSPEGKYIAVMTNGSSNNMDIFGFNGAMGLTLLQTVNAGQGPGSYPAPTQLVTWSPDGKWLAVGTQNPNNALSIYAVTGAGSASLASSLIVSNTPTALQWSPDGRLLAVGDSTNLTMYRLTSAGQLIPGGSIATGALNTLSWSPDGSYVVVTNTSGDQLSVYAINDSEAPVLVGNILITSGYNYGGPTWSPNGQFLALSTGDSDWLDFYGVNFTPATTPQAFTNGLIFGDSTQGSVANANVRFLGGAGVTVKGMVTDASA
jgi:Tol biopolymer transport system component